jgi:hypothetical protein
MGLFDDLKMATGLGLEPAQAYRRAFEKGVLLGFSKFGEAADMFATAAEKLASVDPLMSARATANAHIYRFLATLDEQAAVQACQILQTLGQIEVPGTADEIMDAGVLAAEIEARRLEATAHCAQRSGLNAADAYRRAAHAWLPLRSARPITFALTGGDEHADDGMMRFFYNAALAELSDAMHAEATDPEAAAERFAMAAHAFGRCGAAAARDDARKRLRAARLERPCWFCGRTVRGLGTNMRRLTTVSSEYFVRLSRSDRRRGESFDPPNGIFVCAACAEAVDRLAWQRADEVRQEMIAQVVALRAELEAIESRLRRVESESHTHLGSP